MKTIHLYGLAAAISAAVLVGCASSEKSRLDLAPEASPEASHAKPVEPDPPAKVANAKPFPEVTIEQNFGTLGELVRHIGETSGGGLVLMHGLELNPAPEITIKNAPYAKMIEALSSATGLSAQKTDHYYYLYSPAPVYEPLLGFSLAGQLPERYEQLQVQAAFGGGTSLYNVFGSLSKSLGVTIVADNVISDIPCGELSLPELPLPRALEAVFKSALLPPGGFHLEATDEYILVQTPRTPAPANVLLTEPSEESARALLEKRVDVELPPSKNGQTVFAQGALALRDILPDLSTQLGVPVEAAPALQVFPVTWTVMHQVRVQTALELLIRQWPISGFGYELRSPGIYLREK